MTISKLGLQFCSHYVHAQTMPDCVVEWLDTPCIRLLLIEDNTARIFVLSLKTVVYSRIVILISDDL